MKRQDMIKSLFSMIKEGIEHDSYSLIKKAFRECLDWNSEHPDDEIYMEENPDYIAIEDDVIYFDPKASLPWWELDN